MAVIRCVRCGRVVSNEFPDHIKLNLKAFIECHHCVNEEVFSDRVVFNSVGNKYDAEHKFFEFFMKCKFNKMNLNAVKELILKQFDQAEKSKFDKQAYYAMLGNESEKIGIMNDQLKVG